MNKMQILQAFWSSFGLKAYDETSVPDNAQLPYITYEASSDEFGHAIPHTASLWYRSSSWADIVAKEEQIADFIGRGGVMVSHEGGSMWMQKAIPWAQRMGDESDEMIRRIVLNLTVEFLS